MSEFWGAAGGSAIAIVVVVLLLGILSYALRVWIRAFIGGAVTYDFDLKLEEQKNEMRRLGDQLSSVQSAANAAFLEAQRAAAEKRIAAAEELWREVIRIRAEAAPAVGFQDLLLEDELNKPEVYKSLKDMMSSDVLEAALRNLTIDGVRPFVGEALYFQFYIYRAVNGRVAFLLEKGLKSGEIAPWYKDDGINQLLGFVLTKAEIKQFQRQRISQLHWVQTAIEEKILSSLQKLIAGEISSEEGVAQARKNLEAVRKLEAAKAPVQR